MTTRPTPAAPAAGPAIIITTVRVDKAATQLCAIARRRLPMASYVYGTLPDGRIVAMYEPADGTPFDLTIDVHEGGAALGSIKFTEADDALLAKVSWIDAGRLFRMDGGDFRFIVGNLERDLAEAGFTANLNGELELDDTLHAILSSIPADDAKAARQLLTLAAAMPGDRAAIREQTAHRLKRLGLAAGIVTRLLDAAVPLPARELICLSGDALLNAEWTPPVEIMPGAYAKLATAQVAPPKSGKTTTTVALVAQAAIDGHRVLWISMEEPAGMIADRFRSLQVTPPMDRLHVIGSETPTTLPQLEEMVQLLEPDLVVIDSWNSWTAARGIESDYSDTAGWTREVQLLQHAVTSTGAALVLLAHPSQGGNTLIGSQGVKAQLDGIGTLKVLPGNRRQLDVSGRGIPPQTYVFDVILDGANAAVVKRITRAEQQAEDERGRETAIYARLQEGPANHTELRKVIGGRKEDADACIDRLVQAGKVDEEQQGRARMFSLGNWTMDSGEGFTAKAEL